MMNVHLTGPQLSILSRAVSQTPATTPPISSFHETEINVLNKKGL